MLYLPGGGAMLFLTDVDHVSFEKVKGARQNTLQSATVSLQVVIGLCKRKETAALKIKAGKELSIDCTLEITEGTAKVFWISGADEVVTLIETTGTYSDTITLPDGGNYIGIECENFTGNIELNIE